MPWLGHFASFAVLVAALLLPASAAALARSPVECSLRDSTQADTTTYPNEVVTNREYFATRRVKQITTTGNGSVVGAGYLYDANGNRLEQLEVRDGQPETTTYDYDSADRLAHYQIGSELKADYVYEGYNRKTETVIADPQGEATRLHDRQYGYDQDKLTQIEELGADGPYTLSYAYDANGNTIAKTQSNEPNAQIHYEYDARDQLTQVTRGPPGGDVSIGSYDYNHAGLRVRARQGDRGAVDYFYDESAVLEERAPTGELQARYHNGEEALRLDDYTAGIAKVRYYHQDALGTVTHLSREDGTTSDSFKVDPWGRPRAQTNLSTTANRKLFTGQEYDSETQLYYYKSRFYDPDTGRFLSQDSYLGEPGVPASLHRYLYVMGNPTRYRDPTGHWPEALDEWARSTDIMSNVAFRNLSDRGAGLANTLDAVSEAAGDAGARIAAAHEQGGLIQAASQLGEEEVGAATAVAGGLAQTFDSAGEGLNTVGRRCLTGGFNGQCDDEALSGALDAVLGTADLATVAAGGIKGASAGLRASKNAVGAVQTGIKIAKTAGPAAAAKAAATGLGKMTTEAASAAQATVRQTITALPRATSRAVAAVKHQARVARVVLKAAKKPFLQNAGRAMSAAGPGSMAVGAAVDGATSLAKGAARVRRIAKGAGASDGGEAASTALMRHPFSAGGTHVTTTNRLAAYKDLGSTTYGSPVHGLFVAPTAQIDALLLRAASRADIEAALGLEKDALTGGRLVSTTEENLSIRRRVCETRS